MALFLVARSNLQGADRPQADQALQAQIDLPRILPIAVSSYKLVGGKSKHESVIENLGYGLCLWCLGRGDKVKTESWVQIS